MSVAFGAQWTVDIEKLEGIMRAHRCNGKTKVEVGKRRPRKVAWAQTMLEWRKQNERKRALCSKAGARLIGCSSGSLV